MNRKSLELERMNSLKMLDTDTFRPKINAVELDLGNTIKHELAKTIGVIILRNGISPDCMTKFFSEIQVSYIRHLSEDIERFLLSNGDTKLKDWQRTQVVTEARFKGGERRADIYVLDSGEVVEFETNHKVKKEGATTIYL